MKTIYDYIVFTDTVDFKHGNHIVERLSDKEAERIHRGEPVLSFRVKGAKKKEIMYFDRRIRFTSSNLKEITEFAMLDNL